jgi:hypothetical protein
MFLILIHLYLDLLTEIRNGISYLKLVISMKNNEILVDLTVIPLVKTILLRKLMNYQLH